MAWKERRLLALFLLSAACVCLVWPGDAPWICDEPKVIGLALHHLRAGTIPWSGILGSRGIAYGPVAVWLYEALLFFSRDLVSVVFWHALLIWAGCAAAVWWLSELCPGLCAPLGGLALLSPYFWLYSRMLWDNTLLLPVSGLIVCIHLSHVQQPKTWKLAALAAGFCLAFETHLMSLTLVLPLLAHAAWSAGPWLKARRGLVAILIAAAAAFCAPYLAALLASARAAIPGAPVPRSPGFLFPLQGGRLFSGFGISYFLDDGWTQGPLLKLARYASAAALPLTWAGMVLAVRRVADGLRAPGRRDAAFHLSLLGLGVVAAQSLLYGAVGLYGHPHYLGPAWLFNLYFLWSALSALTERRTAVAAVYGLGLAATLGSVVLGTHSRGGTRGIRYGPTLANQIALARELSHYRPGPVDMQVQHYKLFPEALATLMDVYEWPGDASAPPRDLAVVYDDPAGSDGRIRLVVRD